VQLRLLKATGELLVVFDAEARPVDQLRRAVARFAAADGRLACDQAQLHPATPPATG
jgi:hypothetical protein